jgi:hypothetical protein
MVGESIEFERGIMAVTDALDREVLQYVRYLVEHERQCTLPECRTCSTLTNICEFTEGLLFSVNLYQSVSQSDGDRVSSMAAG